MASILQGETVRIALVASSTSTNPQLVFFDADANVRVLEPYERLLIDDIICNVDAGIVDIITAGSTVASSTSLLSFDMDVSEYHTDGEGLAVPPGITPLAVIDTSTANVRIDGTGRIITAGTQGVRPNWKESLIGFQP